MRCARFEVQSRTLGRTTICHCGTSSNTEVGAGTEPAHGRRPRPTGRSRPGPAGDVEPSFIHKAARATGHTGTRAASNKHTHKHATVEGCQRWRKRRAVGGVQALSSSRCRTSGACVPPPELMRMVSRHLSLVAGVGLMSKCHPTHAQVKPRV